LTRAKNFTPVLHRGQTNRHGHEAKSDLDQ
jgi:hypothetical protein